jgi:tetratricopeptide (TPR) repeat protein
MMIRKLLILFTCFFSTFDIDNVSAQEDIDPKENAAKQYAAKNYKSALRAYQLLIQKDENNPEYNLRVGICMLKTNVVKTKAYTYLEKYFRSEKTSNEYYFDLGQAYHQAMMFDEAIGAFNKFIELNPKKKLDIEQANLFIAQCNNAKQLVKKPLNVSFENLGKRVNSEYADYYPFLPTNESFIVFTTRRPGNTGGVIDPDGYYTSEMYISEWKNSAWTKAKGVNAKLNTEYDEEVVGLSADGKQMLVYIDHEDTYGDIYLSQYEKSGFGLGVDLGEVINTSKVESAASISPDGNTLVYASFRTEGKGKSDLWISKKLPDGTWGKPVNIEELNTPHGEDFPIIVDDGKAILFASEGFNSMGGFDVFKAEWDSVNQKYKEPVNIGYPINTPDNNMTVCYMESGRSAYISAVREDSNGDFDLYRVVFEDVPPKLTVISAKIIASADTGKAGVNAEVIVNYLPTNNKQGEYKTYRNGKVAIALDAGKYEIVVNCPGHKKFSKEITVDNRKKYTEIIPMTFELEPLFAAPPAKSGEKGKDGKNTAKGKTTDKNGAPAKSDGTNQKKATPASKPK